MAKLSNIFLCVALLSLLYSTHQAQGRSVASVTAATQWRPLLNATAQQQVVHPDAISYRYCERCTCCANPVICQTFNCCMENVCAPEPSTGLPNKSQCTARTVTCSCSTDTCR